MRINAIAPGLIDTPLLQGLLGASKDAVYQDYASKVPAKRIGKAEDVAKAVMFLMDNDFVTGEILHIDGGGRLI